MPAELPPSNSVARPYMGNEGGGVERWYDRGAPVLRPRNRELEPSAMESPR